MASEFADQLSRRLTHGLTEKELAWGAERIDKALEPVRECLEGLRFRHGCWCELPPNAGSPDHTSQCDSARKLIRQLSVKEVS